MPAASSFLVVSFTALAVGLALGFVAAVYAALRRTGRSAREARRGAALAALGAAAWLGLTGGLAAAGKLTFSGQPPTMPVLMAALLALALGLGLSPLGRRLALGLPLAVLVGVQGFRLVLELLMHRAYAEGLMPVQMSYEGLNFDVATGATALVVAALLAAGRLPRWGVWLWNGLGLLLLVNVVVVSVLSTPLPLRVFMNEPANVWIARAPWVWLPTVMVVAALLGHVLVFRRLWHERAAAPALA